MDTSLLARELARTTMKAVSIAFWAGFLLGGAGGILVVLLLGSH